MVQEHPAAEIDLRDIGRCHRHPAADRQEEHSCRQQQHQRAACAMCRPPGGVVKPQYAQVAPRHASEDRRGDQQLQQELSGRDARQRLFGRGEVLQHGAVEREGPVFVEGEVGGERRGGDGGDDEQVAFQHAAAPSPRNPEGCEHDQERQCGDVSRYGLVEFQSVPDDQRQLCGRSFGPPARGTTAGRAVSRSPSRAGSWRRGRRERAGCRPAAEGAGGRCPMTDGFR